MKNKHLNEEKTKRLKAYVCWLCNTNFTNRLIKEQSAQNLFDMREFKDNLQSLLPSGNGKAFIGMKLANIIERRIYSEELIPFFNYLEIGYRKFNKLKFIGGYDFNDDFWINTELEDKWRWED